jgi:hypothetical protein
MKILRLYALILALAGTLFTSPANAGVPTFDGVNFGKAVEESASNIVRWAQQQADMLQQYLQMVEQYEQMVKQYQQMITSVTNLNFSIRPTQTLTRISDISDMVSQACPNFTGDAVSMVLDFVKSSLFDSRTSLADSQQTICTQTTLLQIEKYNKTVDMLDRLKEYTQLLQDIETSRSANVNGSDNSAANLQASIDEAARTANKLQKEAQDWQGQMAAADAAISTLQAQQTVFANVRLKGKNAFLLGQITQALAFKAAFH